MSKLLSFFLRVRTKQFSSSRVVLLEPLLEEFKSIVVVKFVVKKSENLDINNNNNFGLGRIGVLGSL